MVSPSRKEIEASTGSVLLRTDTDSFLFKRSCSMLAALSGWRGIITVNISEIDEYLVGVSYDFIFARVSAENPIYLGRPAMLASSAVSIF